MSRAAFVFLFLLTIPHVVEALASGQETPIRPALICENHARPLDALDLRDALNSQDRRSDPSMKTKRWNSDCAH
jgi:hypothetical protein